jgi:hypothetical protein
MKFIPALFKQILSSDDFYLTIIIFSSPCQRQRELFPSLGVSNLYRGPSIDASYQVSVHLAEGFQRRRLKYEKLTDDRRQVRNLVGSVYGRSSIKIAHFVPIG